MKHKKLWLNIFFGILLISAITIKYQDYQPETQPAVQETSPVPVTKPIIKSAPTPADYPVSELVNLTNIERTNIGLIPVTENSLLNQSALAKCNDMATRNYWSHNTPDGQLPWIFITQTGYSYNRAGENLAYGFGTSKDTMVGWMKSPKHKENIVEPLFREVGFGVCSAKDYIGEPSAGKPKDTIIIVQHFAQPYSY